MKQANIVNRSYELDQLCTSVRAFVIDGAYETGIEAICRAMERYPHAPQPHNLLGIILEKTGKHADAMKHFRAAWALDPTYLPANHNLIIYGTFYSNGTCAFDESDVPSAPAAERERENGRDARKKRYENDGRGFGRAARR